MVVSSRIESVNSPPSAAVYVLASHPTPNLIFKCDTVLSNVPPSDHWRQDLAEPVSW
jgi:hypothetical protein